MCTDIFSRNIVGREEGFETIQGKECLCMYRESDIFLPVRVDVNKIAGK